MQNTILRQVQFRNYMTPVRVVPRKAKGAQSPLSLFLGWSSKKCPNARFFLSLLQAEMPKFDAIYGCEVLGNAQKKMSTPFWPVLATPLSICGTMYHAHSVAEQDLAKV